MVVRSVICVVDSLVAIVATKVLVKTVGGLVVSASFVDAGTETGPEIVDELMEVKVSVTEVTTFVSS